jgi:hypothetical protein
MNPGREDFSIGSGAPTNEIVLKRKRKIKKQSKRDKKSKRKEGKG